MNGVFFHTSARITAGMAQVSLLSISIGPLYDVQAVEQGIERAHAGAVHPAEHARGDDRRDSPGDQHGRAHQAAAAERFVDDQGHASGRAAARRATLPTVK